MILHDNMRLLSDLGIVERLDDHGVPSYYITLERSPPCNEFEAVLIPHTKQWRSTSLARDDSRREGDLKLEIPIPFREKPKPAPWMKDWTDALPESDHIHFIKSVDWGATSLGPMSEWNTTLQTLTLQMLADPRNACLYWYASLVYHNATMRD